MKPHEDTLLAAHQGAAMALVSASDGRMVCSFREQEVESWEPLLRAAPDMARALYANGVLRAEDGQWHLSGCDGIRSLVECMPMCTVSRAALKKAGVLHGEPVP